MKKIAVILGTAREGNSSKKVADIITNYLKEKDLEVTFVDVADFLFSRTIAFSPDADAVRPWTEIVAKNEGFLFVCPEYNHSYPGELKILIDSLYDQYKGKVAGVVTVSAGNYGGVRAGEMLAQLLHTVNFKVAVSSVNVSKVQEDLDEDRIHRHVDSVVEEMQGL
jgi:NAD(P)H-dependent FMN reductase